MDHYDSTIQIGDLITGYHKGIHELTKIEHRKNNRPLFHYEKRFDGNGKKSSRIKNMCDAAYCIKAKDHVIKKIKELEENLQNFRNIKEDLQNKFTPKKHLTYPETGV